MKYISQTYEAVRNHAAEFLDNSGVGYKCLICGKIIKCAGNGTWQGLGYMNIAMQSHMGKHLRNGDIKPLE